MTRSLNFNFMAAPGQPMITVQPAPRATFSAEYTDTFGGEANYSWVRRAEFTVPVGAPRAAVMRAGKKALGLTGVRCTVENYGDDLALYPAGSCTVAFINFSH